MAQDQTQTIPRDKFLTMSVNLLHKALLEPSRTDAKALYRDMVEGRPVHLTRVQMEDKSQVRFDLALDHSEFRGKLNFGTFRNGLTVLIGRLVEALEQEQNITVFTAQHDPNVMIFGITGVTVQDNQANVMVLGADAARGQPSVVLKLMYLDPQQFGEGQEVAAAPAGESRETPAKG